MAARSSGRVNNTVLPDLWRHLTALPPNKGFPLWAGGLEIAVDGASVAGRGQAQFVFRPSPCVRCAFASRADSAQIANILFRPVTPAFPDFGDRPPAPGRGRLWSRSSPGKGYQYRSTTDVSPMVLGDPSSLSSVVIGLINFTHVDLGRWQYLDGETSSRTICELDVGPWRLTIWGRQYGSGEEAWWHRLDRAGGYAFTHAVDIRRMDGEAFHRDEIEPIREALFHVLSFVKGRLVGLALVTGYRDDELTMVCWQTTTVEPWDRPLTWFDSSLADELGGLVERYIALAQDPFWTLVLRRAIRMTIHSNRANPLDAAIPSAAAALELLGWAVENAGLAPELSPNVQADKRIRGLLTWAGIPVSVPPELPLLEQRARNRHQPVADAPAVIVGIRNRLMHPPKRPRAGDWPDADVMLEAFRLALEFAELSILRLLDYHSAYGHRRHIDGRWIGDTDPVPWRVS